MNDDDTTIPATDPDIEPADDKTQKTKTILVRVPLGLAARVKRLQGRFDLSASAVCRRAIELGVDAIEGDPARIARAVEADGEEEPSL